MADIQNHGQTVGRVTTTFNGEKIQVDVYEDRCVILPDGTVRKVKQEVVDTLIAKNRVSNPTPTPQEEPMPEPTPAPEPPQQYTEPSAPEQEEYQQPQESAQMPMQQPAGQPNVQQFINQLHNPAAPAPQPAEQPAQQEVVQAQPESQQAQPTAPVPEQKPKKSFFNKEKKEKPKKEKKKSKAGVVVVGVLVAVVAACSAMYAFVPAFYDGVNGILTSITGTQVGIPPVTTTKQTITSQQAASALGEDALSGIDLSGDVTIDFYAKIHTADGQEYEVPLSSADLANGTIQSLLEASGSGSTTNTAQ